MRWFCWIVTVGLLAGCKPGVGEPCEFRKQDCSGDHICVKPPHEGMEGATCMNEAQAKELCAKEKLCRLSGACSYTIRGGGVCAPLTDADCKQSEPCKKFGRCTFDAHMCIVGKADDCKEAEACIKHGNCTAQTDKRPGRCVKEKSPQAGAGT